MLKRLLVLNHVIYWWH